MKNLSYWEKDVFLQSYDLIIVGAGITGLSTALFYKQEHPKKSVLVLERGALPQGASTRNAGFACIGSITEHLADLERTSEGEVKNRIRRRYEGLELLKSTLGEEAIDYEQCGGYELFTSAEAFEGAESELPKFNRWMSDLIQQDEVFSLQELNGHLVIHNRLEGALHPGKMMHALIELVKQEGIEIRWNAAVREVQSAGIALLDDGAEYAADQILIAANGFAKRLVPELDVRPGRGFVFITSPIEKLEWRGTFHYDRGYVYFRNIGDRLLLGGARNIDEEEETTDRFGTNAAIKDYLIEFASDTLRLSEGWEIEHEWSGIMGFTETKTPIIEQVDSRIFAAVGLSGMGISIGMRVGKVAATLLSSKSR